MPDMKRTPKYHFIVGLERVYNHLMRWALRRGYAHKAFALLETTGRVSGLPRHTPIGNGLDGPTFWLIAAHGRQADYVRNLLREPRVRVKVNRVWRDGTAHPLPDDDVNARSHALPYQWDAWIGRKMATAPLTIRIDLDS